MLEVFKLVTCEFSVYVFLRFICLFPRHCFSFSFVAKTQPGLESEIASLRAGITAAHEHARQTPYELRAVLLHDGRADSGHYWACLRAGGDGEEGGMEQAAWVKVDDANCSAVR